MTAQLETVREARERQAERAAAATAGLAEARAALTAAERIFDREAGDLARMDRAAVAKHEATITAAQAQRAADARAAERQEADAAARRQRQVEAGLIALGRGAA